MKETINIIPILMVPNISAQNFVACIDVCRAIISETKCGGQSVV